MRLTPEHPLEEWQQRLQEEIEKTRPIVGDDEIEQSRPRRCVDGVEDCSPDRLRHAFRQGAITIEAGRQGIIGGHARHPSVTIENSACRNRAEVKGLGTPNS